MKKWLTAALMITALLIAGCSKDAGVVPTENSTLQNVAKNKKLVIGMSPGYFPFDMKDPKGDFVGYDVDTANAIGEWLGVPVEYKQFTFDGLVPALQTGEIDMILAGMTITRRPCTCCKFFKPLLQNGSSAYGSRVR